MRMRSRSAFFLMLLVSCSLAAAAEPTLTMSPPTGKFGMIARGSTVSLTVTVTNHGARAATVKFVPTCTCLTVEPASLSIPAGDHGSFTLRYDSSDDTGITRKDFLVVTDPPGLAGPYYSLVGTVRAVSSSSAAPGATPPASPPAAPASIPVTYYYTLGCRSCEEFLSTEIPRLEKSLGVKISLEKKNILDPESYEEVSRLASSRGETIRAVPVLHAGSVLLQGDAEIRAKVAQALAAEAAAARPRPAAGAGLPALPFLTQQLSILPIAAAGLIDGVNPCAFTTLIFLLASLALAGRGRREVLLIGSLFSLAVFLSYLGIGYGLFAALRAASTIGIVSLVLRWVLVAALVVFAGLSVYDYTLIRRGRPTEILLQLPAAFKRQIHTSIRTHVRTAAIAGSSLVLGFLVSIFEFACTGQVYLPLLAYVARIGGGARAFGLLVLYNVFFILPLLLVFAASYLGVSSGRITTFFQTHMGKVKLALAVVFVGLAAFTLVG